MDEVLLIDAGVGNLRSVQKALEHAGASVTTTDDPYKVAAGKRMVLPGVGAFGDFMAGLKAKGLDDAVRQAVSRGAPMLGICVGMQALFDVGEEMGRCEGLGLLRGSVVRFPASLSIKVPHTGWNQVRFLKETPLFEQIQDGAYVYFNHSFFCQAADAGMVIARTDYGIGYASAVQLGNIFGVQFHPEKSQRVGLQILKNFLEA